MTALQKALVILVTAIPFQLMAEPASSTEAGGAAAQPDWAAIFENSEWVLHLNIEGIGQLVNPAMSRNQVMAVEGYRYSASVLQSWKGEHKGTIRFQVGFSDCSRILQVDREYIVFGSSNFHGVLESDACEKIIAVDEAQALLPELDKFIAGS